MTAALNTKLLIVIAVLLAIIAADLSYTAYQSHLAAVAAAAMNQRQTDAETAHQNFLDDYHRAQRDEAAAWGNTTQKGQHK